MVIPVIMVWLLLHDQVVKVLLRVITQLPFIASDRVKILSNKVPKFWMVD